MKNIKDLLPKGKLSINKEAPSNAVLMVTEYYFAVRGWDKYPKEFWVKNKKNPKYSYARNAADAKRLLLYCDNDVTMAINEIYREHKRSEEFNHDWRISTIFKKWKKNLGKGEGETSVGESTVERGE